MYTKRGCIAIYFAPLYLLYMDQRYKGACLTDMSDYHIHMIYTYMIPTEITH